MSGCKFCNDYDFGRVKCEIDRYGANIIFAGGSNRFKIHEQFNFCPMCGKFLKVNVILGGESE